MVSDGAGYWVGIDPGRLAGGLGVVGYEGVVYVGWWRAVGKAWEARRYGPEGEATRRFSTLGGGVRWLVDGYGGRCVLGGSTCQWRSLKKALTAWPASDCLTTAIARIEWAIAECRAPSAE